MNLRLNIAPETEQRLRARAEAKGLMREAFMQGLLESTLAADVRPATAGSAEGGNGASGPSEPPDADEEQDLPALWRGVFATEHQREALFTQDLAVPPSGLPRREPNVILNPRRLDDED